MGAGKILIVDDEVDALDNCRRILSRLGYDCLTEHDPLHAVQRIRQERPDLRAAPGNFVDRHGKILGGHRGIYSYTVGQRRGLNIASTAPYYVLDIDTEKNEVVLGREDEQTSDGLVATAVNWVSGESIPDEGFEATTKIRYRHSGVESKILPLPGPAGADDRGVIVRFSCPQKAVTPGQAAVFYRENCVLGGGWIVRGVRAE